VQPRDLCSFRAQANVRRQFMQDGGPPLTDLLTEGILAQALTTVGGWLDRNFSPRSSL
jgi:hypothetical protein